MSDKGSSDEGDFQPSEEKAYEPIDEDLNVQIDPQELKGIVSEQSLFVEFDKLAQNIGTKCMQTTQKEEQLAEQKNEQIKSKKQIPSIIQIVEKQSIIKEAQLERLGGIYNFFYMNVEKYSQHVSCRKNVLNSMLLSFERLRSNKKNILSTMKDYFKQYAVLQRQFCQKCYKLSIPARQESQNKVINLREELKGGLERLFILRKSIGSEMIRVQRHIQQSTFIKLEKAFQNYEEITETYLKQLFSKRQKFEDNEKKFKKRIEKLTKIIAKNSQAIIVSTQQDLFVEMVKFIKDEKQIRESLFNWGKEITAVRELFLKADFELMKQITYIIDEFKNFNAKSNQINKKKLNFVEKIKDQITSEYAYEKLCLPLDADYVLATLNIINKKASHFLRDEDYDQFLKVEYFDIIVIKPGQFLKGVVIKTFPLKHEDEELVRSISGNLIYFNKKSNQVKNKMCLANTKCECLGKGMVQLRQKQKGIIFDSENTQRLYFRDNDRAEQLFMSMNQEAEPIANQN